MIFVNNNPYGLDHTKVAKRFTGELTYLGTFAIDETETPWAWYTAWSPDVSAGHKDFMGLLPEEGRLIITGRNYEDFEKYLNVTCAICDKCNQAIYSSYTHHMRYCMCHDTFIDGGRSYCRSSTNKIVIYNLLSGQFTK